MRIKFIEDTTVGQGENKYLKFYRGEVRDLPEELSKDLLIMGVAERYYQLDAIKIQSKHLHKASLK